MAGQILTASQFPAKADPDKITAAMTDSLLAHYIPASFGLWVLGLLILFFYPIDKKKHEENVALLGALEAEARAREAENNPIGGPAR